MRTISSILFAFYFAASAQTNFAPYILDTSYTREVNDWPSNCNASASMSYRYGQAVGVGVDTAAVARVYCLRPTAFRAIEAGMVGIIDTGVAAVMPVTVDGWNPFNQSTNCGPLPEDGRTRMWHGTAVASIVSGQYGVATVGGLGMYASGFGAENVGNGVRWFVARGYQVVIVAAGYATEPLKAQVEWDRPTISATEKSLSGLKEAIEYAGSNGVVVVCAGPEGYPALFANDWPTSWGLSNVITAAAANRAGDPYGSLYNPAFRMVLAPGRIVFVQSTNGALYYASGTSYAAAHVGALLGQILARYRHADGSRLTGMEALDWMLRTTEHTPSSVGRYSGGFIRSDTALDPMLLVSATPMAPGIRIEAWTGNVWTNIGPPPVPFKANGKCGAFRAVFGE